jgi:hypothetical protein
LGVDVIQVPITVASPNTIHDVCRVKLDKTLEFPHLQTEEQAVNLIQQFRFLLLANEPTKKGYKICHLLPLAPVPGIDGMPRFLSALLLSETTGAVEMAGRSDKSQHIDERYFFVRCSDGPALTDANIKPGSMANRLYENKLRYRSDHTMMAWCTAITFSLRRTIDRYAGVCMRGLGCAPFLSIEHKATDEPTLVRKALHQAACSLYGWLVERQRLQRHPEPDGYLDDPKYATMPTSFAASTCTSTSHRSSAPAQRARSAAPRRRSIRATACSAWPC